METPRAKSGLLLITGCANNNSLHYTFPDGSAFTAGAGELLFFSKGSRYYSYAQVEDSESIKAITVNFRICDADGKEIDPDCGVLKICRDNGELLPLFLEATKCYKSAMQIRLKAKVYEILSLFYPLSRQDDCCIEYIKQHFTQRFSIPQLAKRCALSETNYRRRFKAVTGLTPTQYIAKIKIEKACQMLLSDDISPQRISDFLNFYSLPYFYKVFKESTGMTPNQYRKHHRV